MVTKDKSYSKLRFRLALLIGLWESIVPNKELCKIKRSNNIKNIVKYKTIVYSMR